MLSTSRLDREYHHILLFERTSRSQHCRVRLLPPYHSSLTITRIHSNRPHRVLHSVLSARLILNIRAAAKKRVIELSTQGGVLTLPNGVTTRLRDIDGCSGSVDLGELEFAGFEMKDFACTNTKKEMGMIGVGDFCNDRGVGGWDEDMLEELAGIGVDRGRARDWMREDNTDGRTHTSGEGGLRDEKPKEERVEEAERVRHGECQLAFRDVGTHFDIPHTLTHQREEAISRHHMDEQDHLQRLQQEWEEQQGQGQIHHDGPGPENAESSSSGSGSQNGEHNHDHEEGVRGPIVHRVTFRTDEAGRDSPRGEKR